MGPVVAPGGTEVVIFVEVTTVQLAATPLKLSVHGDVKELPDSVTAVPTPPEVGENEPKAGATSIVGP